MKKICNTVMTIAVLGVSASASSAAIVASWNYGLTSDGNAPPECFTNGVTVTKWFLGPGLTGNNNSGVVDEFGNHGEGAFWRNGARNWSTTFDDPDNRHVYLTVGSTSAEPITLTSVDYNKVYVISGQSSGPSTYRLGYTLDGGENWIFSSERAVLWEAHDENGDEPEYVSPYMYIGRDTMDTWDFDDFVLAPSQTMELRLWAYGPLNISGGTLLNGGMIYISEQAGDSTPEFVLHGTLAEVPEPSTVGASCIGSVLVTGMSIRRRRNPQGMPR